MIKVRVKKLSDNKNTYRTPVEDFDSISYSPKIGVSIIFLSSAHESGGVVTSEIKEVQEIEKGWVIKTKNSTYEIVRQDDKSV